MFFLLLEMLLLVGLAGIPGWFFGGVLGAAFAALLALFVHGLMLQWKLDRLENWLSAPVLRQDPPWQGVWREIAERVQRLVRQQERRATLRQQQLQDFLLAIQASPNGVILLDEEARIEWCNDTAASHLGLDAQRDHLQHIVHLVRDPVFARYFSQDNHASEAVIEGRGSSALNLQKLSVQLHAYGEGRLLLLTRDITALAQADAMRRDFVANVSHEIRTPLTVLSGFVETLQSIPLNEQETQHYLQLMSVQSDRIQSLVADLLTLSQLEGSQLPSTQDKVSLAALMLQVTTEAQAFSDWMANKGEGPVHQLEFAPVPDVCLTGSRSELLSAVSNLVSNAIRYTPLGGRIQINWSSAAEGLVFAVHDTGPGIAAEHLPRLAERFYRVDRCRSRETGGTGLGLAITKHVMQRHGGELRIQSVVGVGSTFKLLFPASRVLPSLD
ncbi:phosphate regulon sensor histidine kinase PhoR [uncultured Limnohabitans sp.]|jgi:two-component system, OmpR family, phosphate regulon sensor histidine kinase PhoR|uniref:phosphate regulon sensor histidine kinase PhoR n=1 Tax=uncultured Limnohabitans sp. TaxID=768543 RepID=UPI00261D3605|nr:phosphate regulon sensor histidine kinase PhoR [uncultured Limnohabitans sp.]